MTAPAPLGTGAQPDPRKPAEPDAPAELQEHAQLQEQAGLQEPADEEITEPEKRMAPLGVIAMIVVVLGIAAGLVAVLTHGFHTRTRLVYQVPAVFKLRPGDCFNSGTNDISITPRACSSPHDAEVFATFHATGTSWPGDHRQL